MDADYRLSRPVDLVQVSARSPAAAARKKGGGHGTGRGHHKPPTFPVPRRSVVFKQTPRRIGRGQDYDGRLMRFDRGTRCTGQVEGTDTAAVFILEDGATLRNAVIGANQAEGVHCLGACRIINVWWEDVCEDALTLKGDGNALVYGGGARAAEDKIIQHNGLGEVWIEKFSATDFGKLYRSCGNCKRQGRRVVTMKDVVAIRGKDLIGINVNYGDVATVLGAATRQVKETCAKFVGNDRGREPVKAPVGSFPKACSLHGVNV
ncbi:pectate lyase [Fimicolochytrium jonesii]|uniref:pectate lyase n=1 Tax=Fimicolochytrium jonesii TaxID=1396493 RepID=UPI0022FDEF1E|nr:pectate lyase [Fimicolochytrium jonesii]KAI8816492.1 pectate lyase [Fimicolochytrium jonesii]